MARSALKRIKLPLKTSLITTAIILFLGFCNTVFAASGDDTSVVTDKEFDYLPKWGIKVEVSFSNEMLVQHKARLLSLIDSAFVSYSKMFGGPPKKLDGLPYDRLTVNVDDNISYEADPEILDIGVHDKLLFGFYSWELAVIHEVLHLWSAETFRYADGREQWFNEGVSEYLTLRLGAKLGLIVPEKIVSTFAAPIATYLTANGVGKVSLRKAGSSDQLKRDHYFLVYHGGYVVGLVLDHQIRLRSNGTANIEDLMRSLYRTNSRDEPYSMQTLIRSIRKSTGLDFTAFFERYVDGLEVIPVGSFFDIGMLELFLQYGVAIDDKDQKVLKDMLTFNKDT